MMGKLVKTISCLLALLIILSCSKDDEPKVDDNLVIEFETVCGWNIGNKFISIKKGEIKYGEYISSESKPLSDEKWNELTSSFDIKFFESLDYNTCNVCVDGCDEIIRVSGTGISHEIRYNPNDTIPEIRDLQEILRSY